MIKKILLLLLLPLGLYSLEQSQKDEFNRPFQEKMNDSRWEKYLTKEGRKEFLKCVQNPWKCTIPLIISVDKVDSAINWKFQKALRQSANNPEKRQIVMNQYLGTYLTTEGIKHFCTITGKNDLEYGDALQWLKSMYKLFSLIIHGS